MKYENLNNWKFDDLKNLLANYQSALKQLNELNSEITTQYNTIIHLMNEGLERIIKDENGKAKAV